MLNTSSHTRREPNEDGSDRIESSEVWNRFSTFMASYSKVESGSSTFMDRAQLGPFRRWRTLMPDERSFFPAPRGPN